MSWDQGNVGYRQQSPYGQGSSGHTRRSSGSRNGNSYQNNDRQPDGNHAYSSNVRSGDNDFHRGDGRRSLPSSRRYDGQGTARYSHQDSVHRDQVPRLRQGHQDSNRHDQAPRPRMRPIEISGRQPDQTEEAYRLALTARIEELEHTRQEIKDQIHNTLQHAHENRHEPNRDWIHRAKTKLSYLTRERYLIRRVLFGLDGGNQVRHPEKTGPSLSELFMKIAGERLEPELFEEILNDAKAEVEMAADKTHEDSQADAQSGRHDEGGGVASRYGGNDEIHDLDLVDDEADRQFNR